MKILVTGGHGYVGSVLVPHLLKRGHDVTVVDTQWFGRHLESHSRLTDIEIDSRDLSQDHIAGHEAVIHLANIANDPAVDLDPLISWQVNVLATQRLASLAAKGGAQHLLFASSGSVYGINSADRVVETEDLVPISVYNETKMVAERVALSYQDQLTVHCIRPATVCGPSPRIRYDVSVNMFVIQAFRDGKLTVFGGEQIRPNIHIEDLVMVFGHFLEHRELPSGCYNAGFENLSVRNIAEMVSERTGAVIEVRGGNDPRSYRLDSSKLLETGFRPKRNVRDAIDQLLQGLQEGSLADDSSAYSVAWLREKVWRLQEGV